ncbi:MAG: ADP-ribosylation/crystallin J1, partial [Alphaproteobacteria bacterium]|nr:ADP-ribosylation/crystallin J1 [Alphaproteobacteria bacterium]
MILYRPTGPQELALVADSNWTAWPARLPDQPIFYPVLTFDYAEKIARDWNSTREDSDFSGYVTRFEIDDEFAARYPAELAGGQAHKELWVPAEELEEFNRHIV